MNSGVRLDNSSGYRGVTYHRQSGKYRAYINVKGKQRHLGLFDTAEEAAKHYAQAAKALFGAFAPAEIYTKE